MEDILKKHCPVCKEAQEFVRVVAFHREDPDPRDVPDGPSGPFSMKPHFTRTEQPLAYCSQCKTVIYVGGVPSLEKKMEKRERR